MLKRNVLQLTNPLLHDLPNRSVAQHNAEENEEDIITQHVIQNNCTISRIYGRFHNGPGVV